MVGPHPISSYTAFALFPPSLVRSGASGSLCPTLRCACMHSSSSAVIIISPFDRFSCMSTAIISSGMHPCGICVPGHGLYCVLAHLCALLFALHRASPSDSAGPGLPLSRGSAFRPFRRTGVYGGLRGPLISFRFPRTFPGWRVGARWDTRTCGGLGVVVGFV